MSRSLPRRLPVRLILEEIEGWGRLDELSAAGARLSTQTSLSRGQRLLLSFELHGEAFADVPAVVLHAEPDEDGFVRAELDFRDQVHRRRLAQALLDVLSRH